ncbi:hypothetical protein LCGC14_1900720 [marine sediment metagenome]|uniref:Uncharacterized protein n=1 Tax=marine sediment metagenome TaxID=412755 RepID=A0A0F9GK27_9ZZZZ
MEVSRWEKQGARKNRRTFRNAVATPEGRDRHGRINRILNPKVVTAAPSEDWRRRYDLIDWSR